MEKKMKLTENEGVSINKMGVRSRKYLELETQLEINRNNGLNAQNGIECSTFTSHLNK
jgi:hypothetical protein